MAKRKTMAEKTVERRNARLARRNAERLTNRPRPKFVAESMLRTNMDDILIVSAGDDLYRINVADGTFRKLRWEP